MGFFIKRSISYSTYFETQKDAAIFLNIRNSSKRCILSRCKKLGYEVDFNIPDKEPYGSIKNLNHTKYSM